MNAQIIASKLPVDNAPIAEQRAYWFNKQQMIDKTMSLETNSDTTDALMEDRLFVCKQLQYIDRKELNMRG